jgi:SAM-dependent methyltransferase
MLSKMINPKRILEVGTFTGYATLCLAEGLQENGIIYTIDINVELEDMVRANFKKSEFDAKINYQIGDAKQIIPTINETFDLVFIDADKKNNETYFHYVFIFGFFNILFVVLVHQRNACTSITSCAYFCSERNSENGDFKQSSTCAEKQCGIYIEW